MREGIDQAKQRNAQEEIAGPIKFRTVGSSDRRHKDKTQGKSDDDQGKWYVKYVTPAERIDDDAAKSGTEGESCHHAHTVNSHGEAASFGWEDLEESHHDEWLDDA